MTYRKSENFLACVVTCVNHSRTRSLCFQIWYLANWMFERCERALYVSTLYEFLVPFRFIIKIYKIRDTKRYTYIYRDKLYKCVMAANTTYFVISYVFKDKKCIENSHGNMLC